MGELGLIENLYKCPIKSYREMEVEQNLVWGSMVSGVIKGQNTMQPPLVLQERVVEWGLLKKSMMVEVSELLLWYSSITVYGMTVLYVLFLRKTIY